MAKQNKNSILFTIFVAILILILSVMPTDINGEPPKFYFKGMDKIIHVLMYGFLSFLVLNEYLKNHSMKFFPVVLLLILTWFYSILMELLQYFFVEYRTGDYKDAIANLSGIIIATLTLLIIRRVRS